MHASNKNEGQKTWLDQMSQSKYEELLISLQTDGKVWVSHWENWVKNHRCTSPTFTA